MAQIVNYTPTGGPIAAAASPGFSALAAAGLKDVGGNTWSVDSSNSLLTVSATNSVWANHQLATTAPAFRDGTIIISYQNFTGSGGLYLGGRSTNGQPSYFCNVNASGALSLGYIDGGGGVHGLGSASANPPTVPATGTPLVFEFDWSQTSATQTTLTASLKSNGTVISSVSYVDTTAALQNVNGVAQVYEYNGDSAHGIQNYSAYNVPQSGPAPYVASSAVTIPPNNAAINYSPSNWDSLPSGTLGATTLTYQSNCAGAYFKFSVTGTTQIGVAIDSSVYANFASGQTPILKYSINRGGWQTVQPAINGISVSLGSAYSASSTYSVECFIQGFDSTQGTRFAASLNGSPTDVIRVTGFIFDSGATLSAFPTVRPNTALFFGDSITEAWRVTGTAQPANNDSTLGYALLTALGLNAEFGMVAFAGQAIAVSPGPTTDLPLASVTVANYSANRPRVYNSPTYVFANFGTNDNTAGASATTIQNAVAALIAQLRSLCGATTYIFMMVPPGGYYQQAIIAGVAAANDAKAKAIDVTPILSTAGSNGGGASLFCTDGTHPNQFGHSRIAAATDALAQAALSSAQIATLNSTIAANQTQIATLNSTIAANTTQINTLTATNAANQTQITNLNSTIAANTTQIANLTAQNNASQAQIATLTASNTASQTQISSLNTTITANQTQITTLTAQNNALSAQVTTLQAQLAATPTAPVVIQSKAVPTITYPTYQQNQPYCAIPDVMALIGTVGAMNDGTVTTLQIQNAISQATNRIEQRTNSFFSPRRMVRNYDGNGQSRFVLPQRPILAINQVSTYAVYPGTISQTAYEYSLVIDRPAGIISYPLYPNSFAFASFGNVFPRGSKNVSVDAWYGYSQETYGEILTTTDNQTFTFSYPNAIKIAGAGPTGVPSFGPLIYLNGTLLQNTTYTAIPALGITPTAQYQIATDNIYYRYIDSGNGYSGVTFKMPLQATDLVTADYSSIIIPADIMEATAKMASITLLSSIATGGGFSDTQFQGTVEVQSEGGRTRFNDSLGKWGHQITLWLQDIDVTLAQRTKVSAQYGGTYSPGGF